MMGSLIIAKNIRFKVKESQNADILNFIKKSLNLSDLSDKEKVERAKITKLREFMRSLSKTIKDEFESFKHIVIMHGQVLGLDGTATTEEFEEYSASLKFGKLHVSEETLSNINGKGRAMLFSSGFAERAVETPELQSGLFSYYLRDALMGRASNSEGLVTLGSAYKYLQFHVSGYEHFKQQPVLVSKMTYDPIITGDNIKWHDINKRRLAILVGINRYQDIHIPPLRYAESDVKSLAEILSKHGGFDCKVILGSQATYSEVNRALLSSIQELGKDDLFLFYYTGHGFSSEHDGKAMLYDFDYKNSINALNVTNFSRILNQAIAGSQIVILDTCMAPESMPALMLVEESNPALNSDAKGFRSSLPPPFCAG